MGAHCLCSLWGLCYESRAWEGAGVRGYLSGAAQGHCELYLWVFVPAHMHPLPSLAVTPTTPSSQLLGFVQTLCLIPQALPGKGAVVTWSGCGREEEGRVRWQLLGPFSWGGIVEKWHLLLTSGFHMHTYTHVRSHARAHTQCVTDGGFKER